ncbi:MAG: CDP-alcohol phosphatidyltransferase family protein [Balneolaceae bacterium]
MLRKTKTFNDRLILTFSRKSNYYLSIMQNLPNILSFLRILLAPIFLFMYLQDELVWRSLSIAVFAIAAVTDYFDGYIARTYNVESPSGVFLDPLADKILTFAGFICLPFLSAGQFPWWAIGLIIARDIGVTMLRVYANYQNFEMETRSLAKFKTLFQMIFLYVALLIGVFLQAEIMFSSHVQSFMDTGIMGWILILVVIVTVYTGLEYIYVNRHLFTKSKPA